MKRLIPGLVVLLAGCATAPSEPALIKVTQSGAPEATFRNAKAADIQAKFANNCLAHGMTLEDISPLQVTCVREVPDGHEAIDVMVLIGTTSGGRLPYYEKVDFTTLQVGPDVHIVAHSFLIEGKRRVAYMPHLVQNAIQKSFTVLGAE